MRDGGKWCCTCGRPRGVEAKRGSWGYHDTVFIPRTVDPNDNPRQQSNDLILSVSVYRNGGGGDESHLCNECLRVALRAIKLQIDEALCVIGVDHDKDAAIADLTARLAHVQHAHHNVCFDHNRMQERLSDLLTHLAPNADREAVRVAQWEATRGKAIAAR